MRYYDSTSSYAHRTPNPQTFSLNVKGLRPYILTTVNSIKQDYVISCYDPSSRVFWNSGVRKESEFFGLKEELVELRGSVKQIGVKGGKVELGKFIRKVATLFYTSNLHPSSCACQLKLQSFISLPTSLPKSDTAITSIGLFIFRILLMPVFQQLVGSFLEGLNLIGAEEIIRRVKNNDREFLKSQAKEKGGEIKGFCEKVKRLIYQGCSEDCKVIYERGGGGGVGSRRSTTRYIVASRLAFMGV
ncbi:hypothetical protein TL16_g10426 [Triparma laevis f. inornata]|uniref:Uncharacterized protein n=1 Tax=Triparma laevis f. inornata TaxID=1714386 RepID=A0A9W7EMD8_9STRA|nr:hypothetical protein TL16_g10426 [Triparma laevis f. inornata]